MHCFPARTACTHCFLPLNPSLAPSLQLEEAVELFMFAGRPRQALRILAQRMSDAVEGAAADASRGGACTWLAGLGVPLGHVWHGGQLASG